MKPGNLVRVRTRCPAQRNRSPQEVLLKDAGSAYFFAEAGTLAVLIGPDPNYSHWRNNTQYRVFFNNEVATIDMRHLEKVDTQHEEVAQ
jgi:hypothetical protein